MENSEKEIIAPEQYELTEKQRYHFTMNRRSFFEVLGSGIAITFSLTNAIGKTLTDGVPEDQVAAWIHVGEKGNFMGYACLHRHFRPQSCPKKAQFAGGRNP